VVNVKDQKVKGQGHAQKIYAVKGFSIGDSREYNNNDRLTAFDLGQPG